ncbi:MAG: alpha/beta hydrolase [Bacteroidales bacterium]|nr:alpha/beta hydrolase [Bacteroidales bacterium]
MKRIIFFAVLMFLSAFGVQAQQPDFHAGFGNMKPPVEPDFKDVNYAGDDLEAHRLDIYLPKKGKGPYKAVIAIYGSAWFSNNMKAITYFSFGKPLTDAGFAVVCINHRSSADDKFPAQIHDVKGAIRFIKANAENYNIDESFVGITGFSSGGHLASMAGVSGTLKTTSKEMSVTEYLYDSQHRQTGTKTTTSKITLNLEGEIGGNTEYSSSVDAVVDWFGPVDMRRMNNCDTVNDAKSPEAALIGGDPNLNPEMIDRISPLTYVAQCQNLPRFLVIHGDADDVVPYCQSKFFAEELDKKGALEEFVTVPGGKHGPVTFNEDTFKKMTEFFIKEANNKQ